MWKIIIAVSLALIMILSFTACEKDPSAQEIVDGVIASQGEIKTYRFDMDETTYMDVDVEDEAFEANIIKELDGSVDFQNRQIRVDMISNTTMPGGDEITEETEIYLIGDMIHILVEDPEMPPTWIKYEVPELYWQGWSQIESQIELLEDAQVDLLDSEKVGEEDCWVLQVTMDTEQLWRLFMQRTSGAEMEMPDVAEESLEEMFRSFSLKQWIAKDTYYLAKVEMEMAVDLNPEIMSYLGDEGETTIDATMSWLAYDYNQPVSIELPPEAEEAIELSME